MFKASFSWVLVGGALIWGCGPQPLSTHTHPKPRPGVVSNCAPSSHEPRVVDLTHALYDGMTYWPGGVGFTKTRTSDYDQGYRSHKFEMGENTGTHVDAPGHFVEGKRAIEQIPVHELVVPVVVLNVRQKVEENADYVVTANDIIDWEAINGPVPVASVFVVNTGWYERFNDSDKYLNKDDEGVMHFPGFSKAAAQLLVERDVVGIGIDTLSIDPGNAKEFAAHQVMLGADKYQIENLNNLNELPETGATIIVGVLPVSEGSQAQARILALVPEPPPGNEDGEEEQE